MEQPHMLIVAVAVMLTLVSGFFRTTALTTRGTDGRRKHGTKRYATTHRQSSPTGFVRPSRREARPKMMTIMSLDSPLHPDRAYGTS